ncbi:hypothetical protein RN001_008908 [Aquatica leii]|uniref:Uncharacterized protein n=1 Tax=Aquatica leii TaxID=1421715 RepID=A0AAN7PZK8_9COLE|nr:hypothetical protein RN001_008908 [Aquatica leii]
MTSVKKEKKSILQMICCACRSSKQPTRVQTQECEVNAPSDYVVEKLAIRNLPLTTFATAEDLMRYNKMNSTAKNAVYMNSNAKQTFAPSQNPAKPNLGYLPMQIPNVMTHNTVAKYEEPAVNPFHSQYPPKTVSVKDTEAQLVTSILNKHASLYTLDDKNPIPKNPLNPPRNTVVIPPSVQEVYAKDSIFPSKNHTVQVKVHNQGIASAFKNPPRPQSYKKDMSPEIKQTINALGLAQKPHFPGVQPKNQKSVVPSVTPQLTETEISSRLLVDTMSENENFFKLEPQTLLPSMPAHNKFLLEHRIPKIVENSEEDFLSDIHTNRKSKSLDKRSLESIILQETIHSDGKNEKMSSDDIEKSEMKSSSLESVTVNQKKGNMSTTNQLKPQNLKWKIIIKHHADKPKPSTEITRDLVNNEIKYNVRQCLFDNSLNFPG